MPDGFLISIALLVVVILLFVATRPTMYRVERSININAPPEVIYRLVCELKNWELWSPWIKKDPQMKKTYSGAESGIGSVFEWSSHNTQIGKGRMELIEVNRPSLIKFKVLFLRPVRSWENVEFTLTSNNDGINLTWAMVGRNRYIFKVLSMFFEVVDQVVGKDFEGGLSAIKDLAEKSPAQNASQNAGPETSQNASKV